MEIRNLINESELNIFLEERLNKKIKDITEEEILSLQSEWQQLEHTPVQYLLNKAWFFGEEFFVDERVLIPRFDTEFVLENTINVTDCTPQKVLDLCTGSGILAIMLEKKYGCDVYASDISIEALEVAKINNQKHNGNIIFFQSDILKSIPQQGFDMIVSNPPYLSENEWVDKKTLEREPNLALFADNNGLKFYEDLSKEVTNYLNVDGFLSLEIGDGQSGEIIKYFSNLDLVGVYNDYNKRERNIIFKRSC